MGDHGSPPGAAPKDQDAAQPHMVSAEEPANQSVSRGPAQKSRSDMQSTDMAGALFWHISSAILALADTSNAAVVICTFTIMPDCTCVLSVHTYMQNLSNCLDVTAVCFG